MNIGQIRWPNDLKMASLLYLRFILYIINRDVPRLKVRPTVFMRL
jgi:hypothetical protein